VAHAGGAHLAEGRAALRTGDAVAARRAFEAASTDDPCAEAIEGLGRVAYLDLDFALTIERWERAYAAYRDEGDLVGVVRMARGLACMYGTFIGDWAVAGGWMARAHSLVAATTGSPEAGWVALNSGMFEGDRVRKEQLFHEALTEARRYGDTDLEFATLAYLGASLVHRDRTEEGMMLLDEALAAVAGGDVEEFLILEEIFCQLFAACEHAHDVERADQWIRVGEAVAERRNLPAVSAFCRTHYGGVLTAAGRWPEADATLTEAVRLWGLGRRSSLREGALVRLADLRVRQGRIEEAEQLLDGIDADANSEAARPLAAVHLVRGDTALARDVLERALGQVDVTSSGAAPILTLLVDVHLASGAITEAEASADALASCAAAHHSDYLVAVAALARARVCLAAGTGDPEACLREAVTGFSRAQTPMELARCRLALASALAADRPEVALAEARIAFDAFEQLKAARDVDAAAALLRLLGAKPASPRPGGALLTKRESEVLDLLGHGLSNPEISDRLFISRKTVEHHVGNVLAKLGLRSRTEAAAYATRTKPAPE
jgi:DNA-binding CsgD family transcriptional regulator